MLDILYVLSHKPDNRYKKRFELLKSVYSQAVIYWNKSDESASLDIPIDAFEIKIPANQTDPVKRIRETIAFSIRVAQEIESLEPRCLYVGNLDMLRIAVSFKKRYPNTKIIYEIADLHRLIVDPQKGIKWLIQKALIGMEKTLAPYVDLLVVTSERFFDAYYDGLISKDKLVNMPNLPQSEVFSRLDLDARQSDFTIGYFGWIRYLNQLNMLLDAAQITNSKVVIAGSDNSGDNFRARCSLFDNVEYLGPFNYSRDIALLYEKVDCIFCVYDGDMLNVRLALPNKLYESIIAHKPIFVAKNTYLADLVEDMGIGISIQHDSVSDCVRGIKELQDRSKYESCVKNCEANQKFVNSNVYNQEFLNKVEALLS